MLCDNNFVGLLEIMGKTGNVKKKSGGCYSVIDFDKCDSKLDKKKTFHDKTQNNRSDQSYKVR